MSRILRTVCGVVTFSLVAMGFVTGSAAVAVVPSAVSDFSARFESDASLAKQFDPAEAAETRAKRVAEQGRVPGADAVRPGVVSAGRLAWEEEHGSPDDGVGSASVEEIAPLVEPTGFSRYQPTIPGWTVWGVTWDAVANAGCHVKLFKLSTGEEVAEIPGIPGLHGCPGVFFDDFYGDGQPEPGKAYYAEVRLHDGSTWGPWTRTGAWLAERTPGFENGLEDGECVCGTSLDQLAQYMAFSGNPINNATGANTESVQDVELPGPGVRFDLTRAYSSSSGHVGLLGRGWVLPYEARLDLSDPDRIVYHAESGQRAVYQRDVDGELLSPAGTTSELVETASGLELRTRSHEVISFDTNGRLTGWVDSSGEGLSFGYSGGVLASITDAAGRQITVTVAGRKVTEVSLPDGRGVAYGYDGDLLTSVTDLRGQVWRYGYDAAGRLATITDPLGRQVQKSTYDTSGRVVSQIDATGAESTWAYDSPLKGDTTFTDARGGQWTYTHYGNVLTQMIDPLGNITSYAYDKNLNQVKVVDPRGNATNREFDARGNKITETNAAGHVQTWIYDQFDNPVEHVGPTGIVSTWEYNARQLLIAQRQTTADGADTRSRTWGYNARGLPTSEVSWGVREIGYTYDAAGNRVTQTTGEGDTTRWTHDDSGRVLTETDPRSDGQDGSYTTGYAYDDGDNPVTVTDPRSHQTHFEYDEIGNLTREAHPDGSTTTYGWDAAGRKTSMLRSGWEQPETSVYYPGADGQLGARTDPTGAVTKWGYDAAGRMTSMRLPRGSVDGASPDEHTFRYTYDRAGNRIGERDPAGNWTEYGYNVLNWKTSATDPAGGVTRFTYNRAGMVRTVTDPNGSQTITQWDGFLREDRLTDARGNVTTQAWDADDLLTSWTTPLEHTTSYTYDLDGRQASMSLPGGVSTWTYGYDAAGNQTSVTDSLGNTTSTSYDEASNPLSSTDAEGNTTSWAWDGMNRLTTVTGAHSAETSYTYDQLGNLTSRTDPNGNTTTYGYDAVGRLIETIDPLGRKQTTGYDADGNPTRTITARGHQALTDGGDPAPWTVDYTYDGRGLLTARNSPDPGVATQYVYDELGRKIEATGPGLDTPHNTLFYSWDPGSRLSSLRRGSAEFTYAYDADGNVTQRTYPDGTVIDAEYDVDGRQTTSTRTTDTGAQHPPVRFYYHATGQLARIRYTNTGGAQRDELRLYDAAQRLSGVFNEDPDATDRISGYAITRDGVGNPTQIDITGTHAPAGTRTYTYDERNRLTDACYGTDCADGHFTYSYDPVGNRTEQTRTGVPDPGTTTYAYDAADQLTQTVTGTGADAVAVPYTWDADGNMLSAGDTTYKFDILNRERTVTTPEGTRNTTWDPDGRRMTVHREGDTDSQAFFWDINYTDGLSRLAVQADAANAGRRTWSYTAEDGTSLDATIGTIGDTALAELLTDEGFDPSIAAGNGSDGPTGIQAVEQATWLHHDYLQSVVNTTAHDAREIKTQHDYEPYGARDPTLLTADAFDPLLGYNDQYHDPTGDIHLRARQYNPDTGRFTATDPKAPATNAPYDNTYHYGYNSPLNFIDPTGLGSVTGDWVRWFKAHKANHDLALRAAGWALVEEYQLDPTSGDMLYMDLKDFYGEPSNRLSAGSQRSGNGTMWPDLAIRKDGMNYLYEVKPSNSESVKIGRDQLDSYLHALKTRGASPEHWNSKTWMLGDSAKIDLDVICMTRSKLITVRTYPGQYPGLVLYDVADLGDYAAIGTSLYMSERELRSDLEYYRRQAELQNRGKQGQLEQKAPRPYSRGCVWSGRIGVPTPC